MAKIPLSPAEEEQRAKLRELNGFRPERDMISGSRGSGADYRSLKKTYEPGDSVVTYDARVVADLCAVQGELKYTKERLREAIRDRDWAEDKLANLVGAAGLQPICDGREQGHGIAPKTTLSAPTWPDERDLLCEDA